MLIPSSLSEILHFKMWTNRTAWDRRMSLYRSMLKLRFKTSIQTPIWKEKTSTCFIQALRRIVRLLTWIRHPWCSSASCLSRTSRSSALSDSKSWRPKMPPQYLLLRTASCRPKELRDLKIQKMGWNRKVWICKSSRWLQQWPDQRAVVYKSQWWLPNWKWCAENSWKLSLSSQTILPRQRTSKSVELRTPGTLASMNLETKEISTFWTQERLRLRHASDTNWIRVCRGVKKHPLILLESLNWLIEKNTSEKNEMRKFNNKTKAK